LYDFVLVYGGFGCTTVDDGVQSANELRIKSFVFGVFRWSDRAALDGTVDRLA